MREKAMPVEIVLLAIGEIDSHLVDYLVDVIERAFNQSCRIGEPLPIPGFAVRYSSPPRGCADDMLWLLRAAKAERVLGVIDLDLDSPGLNFVFGLADRYRGRAVIALPRLRQRFYGAQDDEALFLSRAAKEAVHELGHTFGLNHCSNRRCVMAFSNSLADTDYKGRDFCLKCSSRLQAES